MTEKNKTVEQYLKENGEYVATTAGLSMFPLLSDRKYVVKILPKNGRLKKYDVALFRRGKQLVLHRVIKVFNDGYYIRGDNCAKGEPVSDSQVIGILSEIKGKKKLIKITDISYIIYSRLIVFFHPVRIFYKKLKRIIKNIIKGN